MTHSRRPSVRCACAATLVAAWAAVPCAPAQVAHASGAPGWQWGPDKIGGYASDRVLVKLAPGASISVDHTGAVRARTRQGTLDVDVTLTLAASAPTGAARAWAQPPADMQRAAAIGADRWVVVHVPPGSDTPALAARLMFAGRAGRTVQWAEIDAVGGIAQEAPVPNDPHYHTQWGFENTGQVVEGSPGTPGADVRARGAWHVSQGNHFSVIAVLDSGVNYHADYAERIMPGWNIPLDSPVTTDGCGSHGTHVAGVLAAGTDNGTAVAGLAPHAFILPIVVVNPCSGLSSWAADGLYYAVDRGATVANLSLQYSVGTQYFYDAVLYTVGAGVPVVAAAGNNGFAGVSWPAKWPEVIAVGSLDSNNNAAPTSGVGPEVDVAAPGVNILSTTNTRDVGFNSGTSMACPHVTGTVALMQAATPTLSIAQWRSALEGTCVDVQAPGVDTTSGYGRIDAAAAVRAARLMAGLGDLDHDGLVNGADLGMLLANWGECGTSCPCDLNDDGIVNGADLGVLLGSWAGPE